MKKIFMMAVMAVALGISLSGRAEETVKPPELSEDYLSLVMRHLYRWYLDETLLVAVDASDDIEFLARTLEPVLDEGDQSTYLELIVPQISYVVTLKKAHYDIPELDMKVENAGYRIIKAHKYDSMPAEREAYHRTVLSKKKMMDYLFQMRNVRVYPDEVLIERMRAAVRAEYAKIGGEKVTTPQTVYVAPISEVSNNLWVYIESMGKIVRFSSDSDMNSEAFWNNEKLGVKIYDLKDDVVVSLAENAGSNAFVTRDWAARVLYNCVVFGQRLVLTPGVEVQNPAESPEIPSN